MRYSGVVGFGRPIEAEGVREGIWDDEVVEKPYYGDVLQATQRWDANADSVNSNVRLTNRISIVADGFAENHLHTMKYVSYAGVLWEISSIEEKHPRLILSLGGVYHGPTPRLSQSP